MSAYPRNIPTLHEKYKLPPMSGTVDINRRNRERDDISPEDLAHTMATAITLRGLDEAGNLPELTNEVVNGVELRAVAPENIHAALEYAPGDLLNVLQNIDRRLEDLHTAIQIGNAETSTALIRIGNRLVDPQALVPVRKVVPGSGLNIARALSRRHNNALEAYGAEGPADVGTAPPFFNGEVDRLTHSDILKLVCFYNDNMGIGVDDLLEARREAVRNFLNNLLG